MSLEAGGDEQTDERTNERTKVPCVLQDIVPFGAAAQKVNTLFYWFLLNHGSEPKKIHDRLNALQKIFQMAINVVKIRADTSYKVVSYKAHNEGGIGIVTPGKEKYSSYHKKLMMTSISPP